MKSTNNQAQVVDSSAVGRDGYVRVRPTWKTNRVHMMDSGGFGRYIGGLLGAMISAPILVALGDGLAFWQIVVGIVIGATIGITLGHVLARAIWGRVKRSVDAVNPRATVATQVAPGDWMMTQNDGTDRAIRIETPPEETDDPRAAVRESPEPHVRFLTSTGRYVTMPADQTVTIVDLAGDVDLPAATTLSD